MQRKRVLLQNTKKNIMNKLNFTFVALILVLVITCSLQACKKDTSPTDPPPTTTDTTATTIDTTTLTMKVDGGLWTPDLIRIRLINDILSIQAQTNAQEALTITVDDQTTGDYTFEIGSAHSAAFLPAPGEAAFMTGISALSTGEIKITKLDAANKKLSATFHFNGYRTDGTFRTFTEGKIVDADIE